MLHASRERERTNLPDRFANFARLPFATEEISYREAKTELNDSVITKVSTLIYRASLKGMYIFKYGSTGKQRVLPEYSRSAGNGRFRLNAHNPGKAFYWISVLYSLSLIFTAKLLIWIFLCRIGSDRQKEQNGKPAIRPSRRVLSIFCPPSPHFTRDRTKPQVEEVLDGSTQAGMSGTEWLLGLDKVKQGYVKLLKNGMSRITFQAIR